jgi:two-component system LytT family response regulator
MWRALVVDDEVLARDGLRLELERETDISVVAEAIDGPDAVEAINRLRPDIVFLDIQIPGFDGFEVLRRIDLERPPLVVFVTAFDSYAVRAFDQRAVDYLVKPINSVRLHEAVDRAREVLSATPRITQPPYYQRFTIREHNRFVVVKVTDVDWFEAASNYVELHVGSRTHLLRDTLTDLEQRLDPARFVRIHRSTIVNMDRVADIRPTTRGDFTVVLLNGKDLRLSRVYRDRVICSKWPN